MELFPSMEHSQIKGIYIITLHPWKLTDHLKIDRQKMIFLAIGDIQVLVLVESQDSSLFWKAGTEFATLHHLQRGCKCIFPNDVLNYGPGVAKGCVFPLRIRRFLLKRTICYESRGLLYLYFVEYIPIFSKLCCVITYVESDFCLALHLESR